MDIAADIRKTIGNIPYRMALAGGWIDQPFVSRLNPNPPGSMVVISLEPTCWFMERAGMATGTRAVAMKLWKNGLPRVSNRDAATLVKELYAAENQGRAEPSGSQDMIGLIHPGITRIDFDANHEGGIFPVHLEHCVDSDVARWVEEVVQMLPIAPRPVGYNPLEEQNLDPLWIARLAQSGKDCFDAIIRKDIAALGASMNLCMQCWQTLLPGTVRHRTIDTDLPALLAHYQSPYPGAMFSGCGGGYLYVVSENPIPGAFKAKVRLA